MIWFLANWRWLGATTATFLLCLWLHFLIMGNARADWYAETARQVQAIQAAEVLQCNTDKAKSQKVQANYEARIGSINSKYDRLQQYASRCVSISTDTTPVPASGCQSTGSGGLTVDFIRRIARDGDTYRAQRMTDDEYLGR